MTKITRKACTVNLEAKLPSQQNFPCVEYRRVEKAGRATLRITFPAVRFTFSAHRKFVLHSMENFHAIKVVFLATGVNI